MLSRSASNRPRFAARLALILTLLPAWFLTIPTFGQGNTAKPAAAGPPPLVVTIGDVQALIDALGSFTEQVDESVTAKTLRDEGASLGDPAFSAFAKGAGIALVATDLDQVLIMLETTGEGRASYASLLRNFGFTEQSDADADGPFVAATTAGMLEGAAAELARAALTEAKAGRVELGVHLPPLVQQYWPRLRLLCGAIPSLYGGGVSGDEIVGRVLEAEARLALNVLEQVERLDLILEVNGDGVLFEGSVAPIAGSNLGKLAAACDTPADLSLLAGLPPEGAVRSVTRAPARESVSFLEAELATMFSQMGLEESVVADLNSLIGNLLILNGEGFAMSAYGSEGFFDGALVTNVEDAEAALSAIEAVTKQLGQGALTKPFFAILGQGWSASFERDARSVGDLSIHRARLSRETTESAAESGLDLEALLGDELTLEFASPNPRQLIAASGNTKVERLLLRSQAPKPQPGMKAVEVHGPGAISYTDFDYGKMLRGIVSQIERTTKDPSLVDLLEDIGGSVEELAASLEGAVITYATFAEPGSIRTAVRIPTQLVSGIVQGTRNEFDANAEQAKVAKVRSDMNAIKTACLMFKLDHGRYPESLEELVEHETRRYLDKVPLDPWTRDPYIFDMGDDGPELISYGADMTEGGTGFNRDLRSSDRD